jgi:DNA invertase Pin-like site-specific DNA recombinase
VESRAAGFENILVYDVSRWGRFQDADESAYYEYVCKRAGVRVHYCAEEFQNDGSMSSALMKTIKRSMAAEYSRELSVKVFAGQCRLVEMGYRQGSWAGFGFRRQLINRDGNIKQILERGERKSIQSDRIVLVPGPAEEVATVRDIFNLYTVNRLSATGIARLLNERGIPTDRGLRWTNTGIQELLTNPKYVGTNIYNRISYKLSRKAVKNPPAMWIRKEGAFEPIVPLETFRRAQEIAAANIIPRLNDDQMLDHLRRIWAREGKLSAKLINADEQSPYATAFKKRFGTLDNAYSLIGYSSTRGDKYQRLKQRIRRQHLELFASVKATLQKYGATVEEHGWKSTFTINGQFTASLVLCYCNEAPGRMPTWLIRRHRSLSADIVIAARLRSGNSEVLDYFLLPNTDGLAKRVSVSSENSCRLEVYRFETLEFFLSLARRRRLGQTT